MDKTKSANDMWEPAVDYDAIDDVTLRDLHVIQTPERVYTTENSSPFTSDVSKNHSPSDFKTNGIPLNARMAAAEEDDSEDDSEGNPKTFMRVLTRFAERTSMQGVPYINVSRVWYAKLGWVFLFLGGFAAMSFHLFYLIKEYYAYDTHSVVTLGFSTLSFPAVTICNLNPIKSSMLQSTTAELRAFVKAVEPSQIAGSMEEKRKKLPLHNPQLPLLRNQGPLGGGLGGGMGGTIPGGGNINGGTGGTVPGGGSTDGGTGGTVPDGGSSDGGTGGTVTGEGSSDGGTGGTVPGAGTGGTSPDEGVSVKPNDNGTAIDFNLESSANIGANDSDLNLPEGPAKIRTRRFVEGFTFSETNTRYQQNRPRPGKGNANSALTLAGNKSTLRAIEDEFKFLYSSLDRELRAGIGHQIDDMLMDCSFRGIECDHSFFTLSQTAEYGNCFTLEREDYISILGGPGDGMSLIFFTQDEEYIHGITNSLGFKIHIHEPGSMPNPYEEGISVSAGMETNVALKQINIKRLGDPHGDCASGNSFFRKYGVVYTQKTCQQFCIQNKVMERCQCFDSEKEELYRRINVYKKTNITQACLNEDDSTCLTDVYSEFQTGTLSCSCDSPCKETIYTKFLSTKQWPTEEYATILVEHLCNILNETECQKYATKNRNDLALSFLKLVLYFEDLNYENITEEPNYELFQFVSDVGGTIGLWIGLSMISVFEVLQFLLEMVHYFFYTKPKQKAALAKKRKRRQKQQSVRHAIRFSNDLLSQKSGPHTANGKLNLARTDNTPSDRDKKSKKSRDGSLPASETSSGNGRAGTDDLNHQIPSYDAVMENIRHYNKPNSGFFYPANSIPAKESP